MDCASREGFEKDLWSSKISAGDRFELPKNSSVVPLIGLLFTSSVDFEGAILRGGDFLL